MWFVRMAESEPWAEGLGWGALDFVLEEDMGGRSQWSRHEDAQTVLRAESSKWRPYIRYSTPDWLGEGAAKAGTGGGVEVSRKLARHLHQRRTPAFRRPPRRQRPPPCLLRVP